MPWRSTTPVGFSAIRVYIRAKGFLLWQAAWVALPSAFTAMNCSISMMWKTSSGSAGALSERLKVRDIVAGIGSNTTSSYAEQYHMPGTLAPTADYTLLSTAVDCAKARKIEMHVGNLLCSDAFYNEGGMAETVSWAKMGTLAVEMESTALYLEAARAGKRALTIVTISDHLITGEATTAEERQNTFTQMMEIALDTAARMEEV